jgi:hypothetical protein
MVTSRAEKLDVERMGWPWFPQNLGVGMDDLHHQGGVSVQSCVF